MPANISLSVDDEDISTVLLGEVLAPDTFEEAVEGEAKKILGKNDGDGAIRELSIQLDGEAARNCQLSIDLDGKPGIWASPGESILVESGTLYPGGDFSFWARGVYHVDDLEGNKKLDIILSGVSIG